MPLQRIRGLKINILIFFRKFLVYKTKILEIIQIQINSSAQQ